MNKKCGTWYMYSLGCRCDLCKKARSDYRAKAATKAHQEGRVKHGTLSGYKAHKCTCVDCTETYRVYQRDYRLKRKIEVAA